MVWVPLYSLLYAMVTLYWARISAKQNGDFQTYFSAGHNLSPWISSLLIAGASLSGWAILGGADEVAQRGFGLPSVLQAGIVLSIPGVLFFKRIWFVAQRLRLSSQGEMFRSYYKSEFLVVYSTLVAVLFAVAFAGLQLSALSKLVETMTAGKVTAAVAGVALGMLLLGYVVIGGMRAIGYIGALQAVQAATALVGLAVFALIKVGDFGELNAGLFEVSKNPTRSMNFIVAGVIQFTEGLGRQTLAGHQGTAVASLSFACALMGFQASPLALKIVLSTKSPNGFAAGQTWVLAGAFGGLVAFAMASLGAAAFVQPNLSISGLLTSLSPWFSAWLFIGILSGVQLLAGIGLLTAGEALVRNIYKPWFQGNLSRKNTVTITRVIIGLLILVSVGMQALTPITLSALGALALPLSFQLWTPLLGMTWIRWITGPAAVTGVGFGIIGVFLTEPFGHSVLSFIGLDLPWGRWPWTVHSAAWGMAANISAVLLISIFTQRRSLGDEANDAHRFLSETLLTSPNAKRLKSTAWAVVMCWIFLAIGPGLIFGNYAFVGSDGHWLVGMPSLWAWGVLFWAVGLCVIWFLSYKMEMASPVDVNISTYIPPRRLHRDHRDAEKMRLRRLLVTGLTGFIIIVFLVLSFGK